MEWNIRPIEETELETWYLVVTGAEGRDLTADELKYGGLGVHLDRTLAAFDGSEMVGSAHDEVLGMTVPGGGALKSGLVGYVGTMPTHRRRGILTALMKRQLEDLHEEGVPLAHLQASESVIYGRFGYGIGAYCEDWTIERHHTAFARDFPRTGSLSFVSPGEMREIFPELYARANAGPGGKTRRSARRRAGLRRSGAGRDRHSAHECRLFGHRWFGRGAEDDLRDQAAHAVEA